MIALIARMNMSRRGGWWLAGALAGCACGLAASAAQADPTNASCRVATAVRAVAPVTLDGRFDDAVWQAGPEHTGFTPALAAMGDVAAPAGGDKK